MDKKFISSILVVALLNLLGCYFSDLVTAAEYNQIEGRSKPNEIYVITKDSQAYHFSESNFYIKKDTLYGKGSTRGLPIGGVIAFREIASIQLDDFGSQDSSLITVSQYQNIEAETGKPDEIWLTKIDSTRYHFMKNDYYLENDRLYGKGKLLLGDREQLIDRKIALSDIESIQLEQLDGLKTAGLVIGILGVLVILIALVVGSVFLLWGSKVWKTN